MRGSGSEKPKAACVFASDPISAFIKKSRNRETLMTRNDVYRSPTSIRRTGEQLFRAWCPRKRFPVSRALEQEEQEGGTVGCLGANREEMDGDR
jgi:hypothetical protein